MKPNKPLKYEDLSVGTLVAMDYYISGTYHIYVVSDLGQTYMDTKGNTSVLVTLIDINSGNSSNIQFLKYNDTLQTNIRISLDIDKFVLNKLHSNIKNSNKKINYIEDFRLGRLKIADIPKPKLTKLQQKEIKEIKQKEAFFKNDDFFKDYV